MFTRGQYPTAALLLIGDAVAQLRRQKTRKTAVLALIISTTLVLSLLVLWTSSTSSHPPIAIRNTTNPADGTASNAVGVAPPSDFAQIIFGPKVKLASLWPYSSGTHRFAYVFYATKQEYLCNVLINLEQLRNLAVSAEFALIYPEFWHLQHPPGSPTAIRRMLDKASNEYKATLHPMELWSTHQGDPTWRDSLTKLYVFGLTQYSRIVYLDSDGIILNNLDHLFLAPQARIALPRAYWLEEGKLASHIMVIEPGHSLMKRVKEWVDTGGSAVGFDMEVVNKLSASSSLILPHRRYAMLTGEFRAKNHSRYLAEDGPDAEWNPHAELARSFYIHFSDWPLPKPWIQASEAQIKQVEPSCDPDEQVECWNRQHWHNVYEFYRMLKDKVCIN